MNLIIHSLGTWEHPNLRTFDPEDPTHFAISLDLNIGIKSQKGSEYFSIKIATPSALEKMKATKGVIAEGPILIVEKFDYDQIWEWMVSKVTSCSGDNWEQCVQNLQRHFEWEYEDYSESKY